MCHYDAPAGSSPAPIVREEVRIPLPDGQELPALLARPERGDGAPVLVVEDIFGRSPFYEDVAARLAAAGYTALLPDFFFRLEPLPERNLEHAYARCSRLDQRRALRELHAAIDWLSARTGQHGQRVGTIGFCLGGTFVLDLAAERDDLASVCYYGFPAGDRGETELTAPIPLAVADRMRGPILGFWGDQDAAVGMHNVERLAAALRDRGEAYDQVIYPGVDHAFLAASPDAPASYQAAQDSWARTLAFYRSHLGAPA
jgi:carboxymethylenebutenolidase